ncbi:MAG TPA: hypothetical protein VFT22_19435 [Kofleriaceae bacterium]|nr:hypothetical protein [Kofleriaceae bacterium]
MHSGQAADDGDAQALVAAMASGDRAARATLYERHTALLLGWKRDATAW